MFGDNSSAADQSTDKKTVSRFYSSRTLLKNMRQRNIVPKGISKQHRKQNSFAAYRSVRNVHVFGRKPELRAEIQLHLKSERK